MLANRNVPTPAAENPIDGYMTLTIKPFSTVDADVFLYC
jgi:hypothetical protein